MHQFGLELALKMLESTRSKEQTGNQKKSHNPTVSGVCIGQLGQVDLWWVGQTKAQKDA